MSIFSQADEWAGRHHYLLPDLLRVILGVTILLKGIYFISHTSELVEMLGKSRFPWLSFAIAHYVALVHLSGGVLIAIGCLTRLACAFQIPVLMGAVIFVNSERGFFSNNPDLLFSIIVLALLIFFFFYGSGYYSVDHSWEKKKAGQS